VTVRGRRGGRATLLLAGAAAAVVAGLGPLLWVTAGPAWAFTAPVKIDERAGDSDRFEFAPTVVIVDVDDKVLWTNKSQTRHTVTSSAGNGRFDSGQIPPGGQWERRFTVAGTYDYQCEIHPDMVGRIEVGKPATTTSTAPPTTVTSAPPATAPPTTTTTEAPTTTTSAPRPAAGAPAQPSPPVPSSAPAPPPTLATSSTTTGPPTTTTTAAPPTTVTSAPPAVPDDGEAAPPAPAPETPPSTDPAPPDERGDEAAAGARRGSGDDVDVATVAMVSALVAVGLFAAWTLIRVRPGRI
jgi:plastocyanin